MANSPSHAPDELGLLRAASKTDTLRFMQQTGTGPEFVVHYHELWLKGKNRHFFRTRLVDNVRRALEDLEVRQILSVAHRLVVRLGEGADPALAAERLRRVMGIAYFAPIHRCSGEIESIRRGSWEVLAGKRFSSFAVRAKTGGSEFPMKSMELRRVMGIAYFAPIHRCSGEIESIRRGSWEVLAGKRFSSFAVRAKTGGSEFPMKSMELERDLGALILDHLRREGRGEVRVNLSNPDITCRVEVIPGGALIYAERIEGCGGLPAATAGRLLCLLSGGFDSAVAAYKMMRRGVHLSFIHFYGVASRPGESSVPVATEIVERLTPYQYSSKLILIPFETIQREIVANAPEEFRILLYRRMMMRIAQEAARGERALGLVTGDSVGQVASQTLQNLAAVDSVARCTIYRPLSGDDKLDILETARRIGTYQISCEPFEDCCPRFMPRSPALHATAEELDRAEKALDVPGLVRGGLSAAEGVALKFELGQVTKKSFLPRGRVRGEPEPDRKQGPSQTGPREERSAVPSPAKAV